MHWYFITFTNSKYGDYAVSEFVEKFKSIHKAFKEPKELCLFEFKFKEQHGKSFYLSCPEKYHSFLKAPLSMLNVEPVSRPNLNLLKLVCGSLDKQDEKYHSP